MNKLCWQGLDKWTTDRKLAKTIQQMIPGVTGIILSRPSRKSFAFIQFPDNESMKLFLQKAEETPNNKRKMKFKEATDNMYIKGKTLEEYLVPRLCEITEEATELGLIRDKITPLCNMPYEDQLALKKNTVEAEYAKFFKDFTARIRKERCVAPIWINEPPKVLDVKPSPVTEAYRNKVEFNIGFFSPTEIKVGFTNGKMAAGTLRIESPTTCTNITQTAMEFAARLEKLVIASNIPVFDTKTNIGIWRQAVFRCSSHTGETMVSIYITACPESETIEKLLAELFPFYSNVVLITMPDKVKVLNGPGFITERVLGKQYRISPLSFFQVNTLGCEVLYQEVVDLVDGDILLDICCGTGSIGISCSGKVQKVIGIELIPEAVEDAKINAELNGVTAEFKAGKAEDLIKEVTRPLQGQNIFAVVDPPRNGLHKSILQSLRTTKGLNHLVYVSCNPVTMFQNLVELTLPEGNKQRGPPFVLISVQPVDMFPQTPHIETVAYLKRSTIL